MDFFTFRERMLLLFSPSFDFGEPLGLAIDGCRERLAGTEKKEFMFKIIANIQKAAKMYIKIGLMGCIFENMF